MDEEYPPTIQNLVDQTTLKWVFVGGKGGVGKTTTSSSIAVTLAQFRQKVLIISTDPAHNLGDSFQQSFNSEPTLVSGFDNLYAMEVEAKIDSSDINLPEFMGEGDESTEGKKAVWAEIMTSMPGMDEVLVFTRVISKVEKMGFDLIIFDTAPTGHTLKLLKFPTTMEKGLEKMMEMRQKVQGLVSAFMSADEFEKNFDSVFKKINTMKQQSHDFHEILKNPDLTTFVAVCIPEYLSVYETERLVQELTEAEIDIRNIVVNQIVIPEGDCFKCNSRFKMQKKYIDQIHELYDDFHVVLSPLRDQEVKGVNGLKSYGGTLLEATVLPGETQG